ncbi:MAG: hypothetical protein M0Z30_03645 [Actinomycetota bacterium]|nr:hypothetical protein [Actinomycetota bacterium]
MSISEKDLGVVGLLIVIAAAFIFLCLPFRYTGESKGPMPLPSLSCRAPIIIGWAGAQRSPGPSGDVYDYKPYTCGGAARTRLVFAGAVIVVAGGLVGVRLLLRRSVSQAPRHL